MLKKISFLLLIFLIISCSNVFEKYQFDADIYRLKHLKYYGELFFEYKDKTGYFPFEGVSDKPTYVFVATKEQYENTRGNPHPFNEVPFSEFIKELEKKLGRTINEYYDPQREGTYTPNFYIYMINKKTFFFAVHLYQQFPFSINISKNYNKLEISNNPTEHNRAANFVEILNNKVFLDEINKIPSRTGWFKILEEKNLHHSKGKISNL